MQQQQPTCTGVRIRSTNDAQRIFYAVRRGHLRMVTRRLDSNERKLLASGCVYVWEQREKEAPESQNTVERFTEGRKWSPSRVRDEFLFYYEKWVPPNEHPRYKEAPRDWDPLVKQTYSVHVDTDRGRKKWHMTAYFTQGTIDTLETIETLPGIAFQGTLDTPPSGMFESTRAGGRTRRHTTSATQASGSSSNAAASVLTPDIMTGPSRPSQPTEWQEYVGPPGAGPVVTPALGSSTSTFPPNNKPKRPPAMQAFDPVAQSKLYASMPPLPVSPAIGMGGRSSAERGGGGLHSPSVFAQRRHSSGPYSNTPPQSGRGHDSSPPPMASLLSSLPLSGTGVPRGAHTMAGGADRRRGSSAGSGSGSSNSVEPHYGNATTLPILENQWNTTPTSPYDNTNTLTLPTTTPTNYTHERLLQFNSTPTTTTSQSQQGYVSYPVQRQQETTPTLTSTRYTSPLRYALTPVCGGGGGDDPTTSVPFSPPPPNTERYDEPAYVEVVHPEEIIYTDPPESYNPNSNEAYEYDSYGQQQQQQQQTPYDESSYYESQHSTEYCIPPLSSMSIYETVPPALQQAMAYPSSSCSSSIPEVPQQQQQQQQPYGGPPPPPSPDTFTYHHHPQQQQQDCIMYDETNQVQLWSFLPHPSSPLHLTPLPHPSSSSSSPSHPLHTHGPNVFSSNEEEKRRLPPLKIVDQPNTLYKREKVDQRVLQKLPLRFTGGGYGSPSGSSNGSGGGGGESGVAV